MTILNLFLIFSKSKKIGDGDGGENGYGDGLSCVTETGCFGDGYAVFSL